MGACIFQSHSGAGQEVPPSEKWDVRGSWPLGELRLLKEQVDPRCCCSCPNSGRQPLEPGEMALHKGGPHTWRRWEQGGGGSGLRVQELKHRVNHVWRCPYSMIQQSAGYLWLPFSPDPFRVYFQIQKKTAYHLKVTVIPSNP